MKAHSKWKGTTMRDLCVNIVVMRARRRLSQDALATCAGVTRQTISKIESGLGNVTIDVLERIARALECSVHSLFEPVPEIAAISERELARRAKEPRTNYVDGFALLDAFEEADKNALRYSRAGPPRRVAHRSSRLKRG